MSGAGLSNQLCYRIRYNKVAGTETYLGEAPIRPISRWPNSHPRLRTNGCLSCNCFDAGDPIPSGKPGCAKCFQRTENPTSASACTAADNIDDVDCITPPYGKCKGYGLLEGGTHFYNYYSSESHTGFEKKDALQLYFVQDDDDDIWIAIVGNEKSTNGRNWAGARLKGNNVDNNRVYLAFKDDPGCPAGGCLTHADRPDISSSFYTMCNEPSGTGSDCAAWNELTGQGSFSFKY